MKIFYDRVIKRIFDFVFSLISLVILSPLLVLLYYLVYHNCGTPVIFKQRRPGRNGKVFNIYKFRTMANIYDENGELLPDEKRLMSFGVKMRALSLDELPELLNILKGDMSLVGPRPLLEEYLPLYNKRQAHRHDVRPGLTGLAQVCGRNLLSWDEKFEYDLKYIRNENPFLDIYILIRTFFNVIAKKGINSEHSATAEPFTGNDTGKQD